MRYPLRVGAFAALAFLAILPTGRAAEKFEVYAQGSKMKFGRASTRIVCDSMETLRQILHDIRQLGDKEAYQLLLSPLTSSNDSGLNIRDEIVKKLPIVTGLMKDDCKKAPPELIVFGAYHVESIDGHEMVTTKVVDSAMQMHATYFFDIRVVLPMKGSEEQFRLLNIVTTIEAMRAASQKQEPMREGVWSYIEEAKPVPR